MPGTDWAAGGRGSGVAPGDQGGLPGARRARNLQTGRVVALFHPRRQRWTRHFAWSEDFLVIIGRTATGRATVEALQLNRPELLNLRRALRTIGEHPPVT